MAGNGGAVQLQQEQMLLQMQQFQQQQGQIASAQQNAAEQQQQTIQSNVSSDTQNLLRQFASTTSGTGISIPFTGVTGGMAPIVSPTTGALRG